jgi:spore maturation protein CgeB
MRVVMFCHSLRSDWNHGNAHFLRGVATELIRRGHELHCYEPADAWSVDNLVRQHGAAPLLAFSRSYPQLDPRVYQPASLDVEAAVDGADVVLVHEWNDPALVARIGRARADGGRFRLLFHDTHHRAVSAPEEMARYDLSSYDGVLAFGATLRDLYVERGWAQRAWVWHEAADTRVFRPLPVHAAAGTQGDLVWIGNWGDGERTAELQEFLIEPARALGLRATVHGVRYPDHALRLLDAAGIRYRSWLPNFEVPLVFARHRATVHVPRRPYVRMLPGVPTIRPFEALACGIPLVSAPWDDSESLFRPGTDYLRAADGASMQRHLRDVLHDADLARALASNGLDTIRRRHTCAHRVDELLHICEQILPLPPLAARSAAAADDGPGGDLRGAGHGTHAW